MTHRIYLDQLTIEANARFFSDTSQVPQYALTMGIKAIMQAKKILLVVNGENKEEILYQALNGPLPRLYQLPLFSYIRMLPS